MKQKTKYDSKEKKYYVKSKKKRKLNYKAKALMLGIICLALSIGGCFFITKSNQSNASNSVNYSEVGNVNYKVYLKENDYYTQKYLEKGMKYIASLINTVNVDFNYELHSTDNLDYLYTYKIDAILVITDKNDSTKILYEKTFNLKEETTKSGTGNNFVLKDDVDIDYEEYNNYVNSFKRDYGLTVDSNLTVMMNINVESQYLESEKMAKTNNLSVIIPMSEQTIDISILDDTLNNNGIISNPKNSKTLTELICLIFGCFLGVIDLVVFSLLIKYLLKSSKKDLYHATISKYLKDYDRIIITTKQPNVDERLFDEIIRVQDIKELVDLHDMTQKPIMYYEVIPNEKSYFIIISDRLLYKLTITKAWLQRHDEESKK